tara:strand:+ start:3529 stop:4923 length:1395 start_codon:yes stop_codon:yes gene_type:complete
MYFKNQNTSNFTSDDTEIYNVSQLNQEIQSLLENSYPYIYVEGEISNLSRPISGHFYFSLKDKNAQIRCALFRNALSKIKTPNIRNGSKVIIKAKVTLYTVRGDYQLIVSDLFESGFGQLQREFLELKNKLEKQGYFNHEHKKIFPKIPNNIAIITSSTGAAIKDILITIKRRWPLTNILIIPTIVQGEASSNSIKNAIESANKYNKNNNDLLDSIILTRGGGSIEDLWGFNTEQVAMAIYNSELPIVTGVGHEIDFTIADFIADERAATPTAAAEFITPDKLEYLNLLNQYKIKLNNIIKHYINNNLKKLNFIKHRLDIQNPQNKLNNQSQKLDYITTSLIHNIEKYLNNLNQIINSLDYKIKLYNPKNKLNKKKSDLDRLNNKLNNLFNNIITNKKYELNLISEKLDNISPLKILSRGYSITKDQNNKNIKSIENLTENLTIKTILVDGEIISRIENIFKND